MSMTSEGRFAILLGLGLVLALAAPAPAAGGKDSRPNALGIEAFEKGDYAAAERNFRKAVEINPSDGVLWSNLGSAQTEAGRYKEALASLDRALEIDPSLAHARYWRGWTHFHRGDDNKAIVDFDKVAGIERFRKGALRGRGWSYFKKAMYERSLEDFSSVLQLDPNNESSLRGRGWTHYHSGRFREALKDFNKAVEHIKPGDKSALRDALAGKAFAYVGVDDGVSASAMIRQAREIKDRGDWETILVHCLSGERQKAWQLRGGEGFLGIELREYAQGGAAVVQVIGLKAAGPAVRSRLIEGDVIRSLNGKPVANKDDFIRMAAALSPGSVAELSVLREGAQRTIPVEVASIEAMVLADPLAGPLVRRGRGSVEAGQAAAAPAKPAVSNAAAPGESDELR